MTQTHRRTRQRDAVTALLRQREDFRTAQQIHADLRAAGTDVGLTTVYRTLATLADTGEVDVLLAEDGEARYRACSSGHHHHLVCRTCGFTVEVTADAVEQWAQRVARENGFQDIRHTVEIVGTCDTCAQGRSAGSHGR
jgi:Fur family transcriptional regulator, ferric uptake regulator